MGDGRDKNDAQVTDNPTADEGGLEDTWFVDDGLAKALGTVGTEDTEIVRPSDFDLDRVNTAPIPGPGAAGEAVATEHERSGGDLAADGTSTLPEPTMERVDVEPLAAAGFDDASAPQDSNRARLQQLAETVQADHEAAPRPRVQQIMEAAITGEHDQAQDPAVAELVAPDAEPGSGSQITVDESLMDRDGLDAQRTSPRDDDLPPAQPVAPPLPPIRSDQHRHDPEPGEVDRAKQRIQICEREAKAFGNDPKAAPLWFEAGRLYEVAVRDIRQAATLYQQAFKADPKFIPVIHAARRLFTHIGNWKMVNNLMLAEIQAVESPEVQAALHAERGHVIATKLANEAEATQAYREALLAFPANAISYDAQVRRLQAAERYAELVEFILGNIGQLPAGPTRNDRSMDAARLCEVNLGEPERALRLTADILTSDANHREAAVTQVRILDRMGEPAPLVDALEQLARIEVNAQRAALLIEAARLCRCRLNDRARALRLLEQAKIAAPKDLLVLRELGDLLAGDEQYQALADVLLEQAACITDTRERVALHAELGHIFEEHLKDAPRAIEQFQKVADLDATYQPALVSLGRLYFREARFGELAELYQKEIAQIQDDAQKVPRLYNLASILENQLQEMDGALSCLRQALELDPRYIPAQQSLASLLTRTERWQDLIEVYERELQLSEDRDQHVYLLDKIGTLYEDRLKDVPHAIDAYERMLDAAPGYLPAIRSLGKLYGQASRYKDLIRITEQEAQAIQDPKQVVALLYRCGEIRAEHLDDQEGAIDMFRKVLGLAPTYLPALKSLGRTYHQRGMFDALIDMHRQEYEVSTEPAQRASLLFKIGEIYEEKLNQIEDAVRTYREVLDEVPNHHPALRALSRILLSRNDDAGLVAIAKQECEVLEDARERAIAKCRAGLLEVLHLADETSARATFGSALDDDPSLACAQVGLHRIATRHEDYDSEVSTLKQSIQHTYDTDAQMRLVRDLADACAFRAGRIPEAQNLYGQYLDYKPADRAALKGALHCALVQRDYAVAIALGERLAPLLPDATSAASLYLQVASWQSSHLDPPADPIPNYLRALEYAPGDPIALRAVEDAYMRAGASEGLFDLFQQEREMATTTSHWLDLTIKLSDLAAGPLNNPGAAINYLEEAIERDPRCTSVLRRLKALFEDQGQPEKQLRILAMEADASPDPQAAVINLMEVGRLQEEQTGDRAAAADCYLKVLQRDPSHNEAFARAERLLGGLDRFAELCRLYHERVQVTPNHETKVSLLMRAAQLESQRLQDAQASLISYREALTYSPRHVPALIGAADIELAIEQFEAAADKYWSVVQATNDPKVTGPLYEKLGDIYRYHTPDTGRAVQAYNSSLSVRPNDTDVLGKLAQLHISQQAWGEASDVLAKRLTFVIETKAKIDTLNNLAKVYETGLQNTQLAAQFLEQALALDPGSAETLKHLGELYRSTNDLPALVQVLERQAGSIPANQPDAAIELLHELATVYDQSMDQPEQAVATLKRALERRPNDLAIRYRLAALHATRTGNPERSIDEYRHILDLAPTEVEALRGMQRIFGAGTLRDKQFVISELLTVMRVANDDESFFYTDNKARLPQRVEFALAEDDHEKWIVHPDERGCLRTLMRAVTGELSKVLPPDLAAYGVSKSDRLTARSTEPLRELTDQLASALTEGKAAFDVYRSKKKSMALAVVNTDPLGLVIGAEVLRRHPIREQRFLIGHLVESLYSGHHLTEGMDLGAFATFVTALCQAVDDSFEPLRNAQIDADLGKRMARGLSRGAKKTLLPLVQDLDAQRGTVDLGAYLNAIDLTRVRAGLALSCDLESALRLVARQSAITYNLADTVALAETLSRHDEMRELFTFSLSENYFDARRKLHLAIDA